jgi:hypothetical protein
MIVYAASRAVTLIKYWNVGKTSNMATVLSTINK